MRKLVLFMHASLDGFVAGPNGEKDWIKVDDAIFEFASQRTNESDTALYGRVTFEMMDAYWPTAADQPNASRHDIEHSTWYNTVDKVVLSNSLQGKSLKNTTILSEHVAREIQQLKQAAGKEIIMFGSPSAAHSLMQDNLIDEFWIFVNPVVLGNGIPLFKGIPQRSNLRLLKSHAFACGVVCLHYKRIQ
jgi:dihydrofolate reductase